MKKAVRIDPKRIKRFNFTSVTALRTAVETKPELKASLSRSFSEALEAENIVIDEAFKQKVCTEWRAQIQSDIQAKMASLPESKKRYYSRISKGEPLKLKVKVDRKTKKHIKTIREES